MKSAYKALFISLTFTSIVWSQVHFESSFTDALNRSQKEKKILFIKYYNPDCPVCMALEKFFAMPEMGNFYNKYFVNYKMNTQEMSPDEDDFINGAGLKFKSVPFFLFFDSKGNFLHHSGTRQDLGYLISIGRSALQPQLQSSKLEEKYNEGDRTVKTLYAYCNLLHLYENDSLIKVVADDLFTSFNKKEVGSKKGYIVTQKCVNSIENGFFTYWINHLDEMSKYVSLDSSEHLNILQNIILKSLYSEKQWNEKKIEKIKKYMITSQLTEDPSIYLWEKEVEVFSAAKEMEKANKIVANKVDTTSSNDAEQLYILEFALTHLNGGEVLSPYLEIIEHYKKKVLPISQRAKVLICECKYHHKINSNLKISVCEEANTFLIEHKLPTEQLKSFISKEE